jgi:DNA polymerase-1
VLHSLKDKHPMVEFMLKYRELEKQRSAYLDPLILCVDTDGRIRPSWNQLGTESGRFTAKNPAFQTIPNDPEIRCIFIPAPGMVMIDVDYSQIEGRFAAHISQDPVLLEYYRNGGDIHDATSQKLGIGRPLAKVINFAIIYGCQPYKLMQIMGEKGFSFSKKEAQEMWNNFWKLYKGLKDWKDYTIDELHETKQIQTIYGRRRLFPNINEYGEEYTDDWGRVRFTNERNIEGMEREALNHVVQGSAADFMKMGMADVDEALMMAGGFCHLLATIHDELMFECEPERVEEAKLIIGNRMRDAGWLSVPMLIEIKESTKGWHDCH